MKLWDKHLQGVAYTYETHKPLSSMNITGENDELLIVGQGSGDFIVYGRDAKNQMDIVEWAHATPIIDIVSLSKLKNKYFATRCIDGHVNVWSSLNHPDKIAALDNFDGDKHPLHLFWIRILSYLQVQSGPRRAISRLFGLFHPKGDNLA